MRHIETVRRTIEIEEMTNRIIIHPIASRLTLLFATLRVPPNAVSIAGMTCGLLAGVAYSHYRAFGFAIIGFALMICWHVLDGADGQLARLTQRQSQSGKVLDGICDYVTFAAVYTGLAVAINQDHGSWVWGLVALSGACHALQAAAYEAQRQDYDVWGLGKDGASIPDPATSARPASIHRAGEVLHRTYSRLQLLATGLDGQSRRRLAATMTESPDRTEPARRWYRQVFAPSVRRWSLMSANYRTIAIFLFSAASTPIYYFVFEIVGLSALLIALLLSQQGRYTLFFSGLADLDRTAAMAEQAVAGGLHTARQPTAA